MTASVFFMVGMLLLGGVCQQYDGLMHYVSYDDPGDAQFKKEDPSLHLMRGYEKIWSQQDLLFVPELALEDPVPRENTVPLPINRAPGGPTSSGPVYYSAFPGRANLIRWKTIQSIVDGNCTIRLSNGVDDTDDSSYQILFPVFDFSYRNDDGTYDLYSGEQSNNYRSIYEGGKFACGRVERGTFESITVQFPNMTCDEGVLQMVVETQQGKIYQGADIEVINSEMTEGIGACMNEGVCVNGKGVCRSGFLGDKCQNKTQEKRNYTSWLVIFLLIVFAVIVAIVGYISLQFVSQKERWVTKFGRPRKSKNYPESGVAL